MLTNTKPNVAEGWTLQQALELTADPHVWGKWLATKAEFEKIRTPIPSSPGSFITRSPDVVAKCRLRATQCFDTVVRQLRDLLEGGTLIATGSRAERSVAPTTLHRAGWRTLKVVNFERSIVRETGKAKTKIYNVRIFPLAHAPDAADRLVGRSIGEMFLECVIRDPEVVSASKRIPDLHHHRSVFEQGQFPGPIVSYRWPLEITVDDLAFDFVRPLIFFLDSPLPKPSPQLKQVAEVIVDRWQRLRRRLIDAECGTRGTFALNGELLFIDPLQWARVGRSIDVQNSDVVDSENHKPIVRWSGVSLVSVSGLRATNELRSSNSLGNPGTNLPVRRIKRRPMAEAVARGLTAKGFGSDPRGRSWKELAVTIADDMPKYPQTTEAWAALAKAIERHYRQ